jgi:hypothetical protein
MGLLRLEGVVLGLADDGEGSVGAELGVAVTHLLFIFYRSGNRIITTDSEQDNNLGSYL